MSRRDGSVEKLSQLLASGRYPAQSRLPPERELSVLLGVSRSGLREGLEILEAEGRIWRHVGKGTYVGPRPLEGASGLDLITAITSPAEVLEVRLLVEPLIARLAAMRATAPATPRRGSCGTGRCIEPSHRPPITGCCCRSSMASTRCAPRRPGAACA